MSAKAILSASVSAPPVVYVEDVFSTFLYTGNGSTQTITNGIDLAGKGGLVWLKSRSAGSYGSFISPQVGTLQEFLVPSLDSNIILAGTNVVDTYLSNGFTLNQGSGLVNQSPTTYCSWTFRKQPKFFDMVTYTGTGANRTIAHNLGSVPGAIWVKRTDTTGDWQCYHRSLANTQYMVLNSTAAVATGATRWNSTTPTSSVFSLGTDATVNASAGTYVAYVFAHDAGGFGTAGTDNVVSCGSYTGNGSASGPTVTLGWEPQWLLIKRTDAAYDWWLSDNMRGMTVGGDDRPLLPNSSTTEQAFDWMSPTATGFELTTANINFNASGGNYIYIAIRRGPMKTPTVGTQVFNANATTTPTGAWTPGFPVDALLQSTSSSAAPYTALRLTGKQAFLQTSSTAGETTGTDYFTFDGNTNTMSQTFFQGASNYIRYSFRRAPGFFDVVAYTGTGVTRTVSHNLGVVPELMIIKTRTVSSDWKVYVAALGNALRLELQTTSASGTQGEWASTSPTASVFTVSNQVAVNNSSYTYIAYLFATLAGVSKVGSYTGTGTGYTVDVNCGFTAGARFVLIKRTDSTGDWFVWDTARGIISGNDPYLLLNSSAAEVTGTDYIDPLSTGFQISSTAPAAINANGGTYIFLAIA